MGTRWGGECCSEPMGCRWHPRATAPLQSRDGLALILMVAADQPPGIILASGITAWRSQFCCHPALSMANQFPKSACRMWAVHRRLANGKRMKTGLALLSWPMRSCTLRCMMATADLQRLISVTPTWRNASCRYRDTVTFILCSLPYLSCLNFHLLAETATVKVVIWLLSYYCFMNKQ